MSNTNISIKTHFNLYEVITDQTNHTTNYVLCNNVSTLRSNLGANGEELDDYSLHEALAEYNREFYGAMSDKELVNDYGMDLEMVQDRDDWISEQEYPEICQYFIVSGNTADILKDYGEFVYHDDTLDCDVWGVTHYGTHWSSAMSHRLPIHNDARYRRITPLKDKEAEKILSGSGVYPDK